MRKSCLSRRHALRLRPAHLCLMLLLVAAIPRPARAQVAGIISGRVEDATGAPISGANITIKSVDTGATRTATTDDRGHFRVLALPIGPQEVRAEKSGFQAAVRTGVNLEVGQEAVVNLQLQVGEFSQQIIVSAEAPIVNTTTASVSGIVGEREMKDLPLNARSFDNLITLNPGAINYSAMKSPNTTTSDGNTFSVAGRRPGDNIFLLNGIEYTGSSQLAVTPGGASGYLLGIDAVREFNVLTDTYGAQYGKRAGAQVTVVTQSGTNQLHGTLVRIRPQQRARFPGILRQRLRASLPPKPVRRRVRRTHQEGPRVPVRQLRRFPPKPRRLQRLRRSRRERAQGPAAQRQPSRESQPRHAAIHVLLARSQR